MTNNSLPRPRRGIFPPDNALIAAARAQGVLSPASTRERLIRSFVTATRKTAVDKLDDAARLTRKIATP